VVATVLSAAMLAAGHAAADDNPVPPMLRRVTLPVTTPAPRPTAAATPAPTAAPATATAAAPATATFAARTPAVRPRPAPEPAPDPYRCHPAEDISCTVVRETPLGTVIVTLRPSGTVAKPAAWSVVSGAPPGPAGAAAIGGTIYVVPASSADPRILPPLPGPANGAPILD
jgi:hypothetical protein